MVKTLTDIKLNCDTHAAYLNYEFGNKYDTALGVKLTEHYCWMLDMGGVAVEEGNLVTTFHAT